jgi:hypothetical protein
MDRCGWGAGLRAQPYAREYGLISDIPTVGTELPLLPGMSFVFEPNCVIGHHTINIGGAVLVGNDEPIELTHLPRGSCARRRSPGLAGSQDDRDAAPAAGPPNAPGGNRTRFVQKTDSVIESHQFAQHRKSVRDGATNAALGLEATLD